MMSTPSAPPKCSVSKRSSASPKTATAASLTAPFYSVTHFGQKEDERPYWHLLRRPSPRKGDDGTDVLLAFCEAGMAPARTRTPAP